MYIIHTQPQQPNISFNTSEQVKFFSLLKGERSYKQNYKTKLELFLVMEVHRNRVRDEQTIMVCVRNLSRAIPVYLEYIIVLYNASEGTDRRNCDICDIGTGNQNR